MPRSIAARLALALLGAALLASCAAPPNETARPQPTPLPTRPPFPTQPPLNLQAGTVAQTIMRTPGQIYGLDIAAHPTEGWPVVGVMQRFSESQEPIQSFVRVWNPRGGTWGASRQVDVGESSQGMDRYGSIAVGVTGDNSVHAAWGNSDADGGLWFSSSADYGAAWSAPLRLAAGCNSVQDLAASADGWIVVLGNCYRLIGEHAITFATLIVRHPDGTWEAPQPLDNVPITLGALTIAGSGADVAATALVTLNDGMGDPRTFLILSRRLAASDAWEVRTSQVASVKALAWRLRGLVFTRHLADGTARTGILFTWNDLDTPHVYGLLSLDGGAHWDEADLVATAQGDQAPYATAAYDPAGDRLAAIWSQRAPESDGATHFASWSAPGALWHPLDSPLISGAAAAGDTTSAQAANSRYVWLAWVEGQNAVMARALELNRVIPAGAYPADTALVHLGVKIPRVFATKTQRHEGILLRSLQTSCHPEDTRCFVAMLPHDFGQAVLASGEVHP